MQVAAEKAKEMQVLSHEEMKRFLIQAKEDNFYEMAVLELATGMRRGEICALKWSDLNFETGELHIERQVYHVKGALRISKPKTKSSDRIVILPESVINVLRESKSRTESEWIFASPVMPDRPYDPQSIYGKIKKVLKRAQCKDIRFHDLRHTFATTALEHGMDIKTLSAMIGHISSATTIDIYSHVTDTMQRQAANKIESGIGNDEVYTSNETHDEPDKQETQNVIIKAFEPYKGKDTSAWRRCRKSGTGGIYEINDHLFEGRYTPTNAHGKRESHNVYAKTREECQTLLTEMIDRVRAEITAEKAMMQAEAEKIAVKK